MQNDSAAEWTRLTRLYVEKSDEELLDLASEFGNLTDVAQGVLRDELRKRRLEVPQPVVQAGAPAVTSAPPVAGRNPIFGRWSQAIADQHREFESPTDHPAGDEESPLVDYTWKTLLCECDEREQAWQVAEVLRRAGIESWIDGPDSQTSLDVRGPRVIVAADQLDEARAILAQPIPQDVIDQSRVKVEDFVPPACPKCCAPDPLLESIEPTNTWLCENCGARWSDAMAVENTGQNPALQ